MVDETYHTIPWSGEGSRQDGITRYPPQKEKENGGRKRNRTYFQDWTRRGQRGESRSQGAGRDQLVPHASPAGTRLIAPQLPASTRTCCAAPVHCRARRRVAPSSASSRGRASVPVGSSQPQSHIRSSTIFLLLETPWCSRCTRCCVTVDTRASGHRNRSYAYKLHANTCERTRCGSKASPENALSRLASES